MSKIVHEWRAAPYDGEDRPTVSVILPFHNASDWIKDSVASVLSQSETSVEMIVVDDGSTDDGVQIVESMTQSLTSSLANIRIIRQIHSGVSRARNVGTAVARGRYLQYLDADDILKPVTLGTRVNALDRSGADIAYCDFEIWQERADRGFEYHAVCEDRLGSHPDCELLTGAWWPPGACMFRADLVRRLPAWNERLGTNQDVQFLVLAAAAGARFVNVPSVGLSYRVRGTSLSNANTTQFLRDCYQNACELQDRWSQNDRLDLGRSDAILRLLSYLLRVFASDDTLRGDIADRIATARSHLALSLKAPNTN